MNDLFQNLDLSAQVSNIKLAEIIRKKIVWKKQFAGASAYQFCPLCLKNKKIKISNLKKYFYLKNQNKRKTDEEIQLINEIENSGIQPLFQTRYKELVKVTEELGQIMFNDYLECEDCHKIITMEDLIQSYCAPPRDNSLKKYINLQTEINDF